MGNKTIPKIKATLATITILALLVLITTIPNAFFIIVASILSIALISLLWTGLYRFFDNEVEDDDDYDLHKYDRY